MRAAVSNDCARERNWQSQRVTRRSFVVAVGTGFHPVPSHSGQTSAGALITDINPLKNTSISTLHPQTSFAQGGILDWLCTSCEGRAAPVEDRGKPGAHVRKAAPAGRIGAKEVRNRLLARIFTVDIRQRRRTIRTIRSPNSVRSRFSARCRLGMKETCEEQL